MSRRESTGDQEKRARILEAAFRVCERRGVSSARMEEVAALAQVSKGTLYRFFKSKEDLFLATIIQSYEEGLKLMDADAVEGADPMRLLRELLEALTKVLSLVAPRTRVHYQAWGVVAGVPEFQQRLYGFLEAFHRDRHRQFVQLVHHGQVTGAFRSDVSAEVVAHSIQALLGGFIYRSSFDPEAASPDALRACFDTLVNEFLDPRTDVRPLGEGEDV